MSRTGMRSRTLIRVFVLCCFSLFVVAENDAYLSTSSTRRRQFEMDDGMGHFRCSFEPLFSFGSYFLGRFTEASFRSTVLPYTKNSTIVAVGTLCFLLGTLLGFAVGFMWRPRPSSQTPPSKEPEGEEVCFRPLTENQTKASNGGLEEDLLEESLSLESWTLQDDAFANLLAKKETKTEPDPIKVLCRSMEDLNVTLKSVARPMVAIQENTETIASHVGVVSSLTNWMAGRKSKKDIWLSTMDSISSGVIVMNIALAFSSLYFGRWQDWGVGCEPLFSSYDTKAIFGKMWCYVKEPYGFILGCILWFFSTRCLSTSGYLKKREALPTLLLILTLLMAGVLHSTVVNLLGGSWNAAFLVWVFYSGFLVRNLDCAKMKPLENQKSQSNGTGLLGFLFTNDHATTTVSVLIFPVLVSVLPFWNKGLSLWMYYTLNERWHGALGALGYLYTKLYEFGLY